MKRMKFTVSAINKEVNITTSRSGGPGGQHVNKVETKVILRWNVYESNAITAIQKEIIKSAHANRITQEGDLLITVDSSRSQLKNKTIAFKKLERLLAKAFAKKRTRKATRPSKASRLKRLNDKKKHAEKKSLRKRIV